jgi:predicted flap endonuclease-1-like 5' DNA nuclease
MFNYFSEIGAFDNLNVKNKSTAVFEIVTMLVGSFLLGYIVRWLICRGRGHSDQSSNRRSVTSRPNVAATRTGTSYRRDDLKIIEGVGPKIEQLLNDAGIVSYAQMARTPASKVKSILDGAGPRFQMHDPSSWAEQAELARDGKMAQLEKLKAQLTGGRS